MVWPRMSAGRRGSSGTTIVNSSKSAGVPAQVVGPAAELHGAARRRQQRVEQLDEVVGARDRRARAAARAAARRDSSSVPAARRSRRRTPGRSGTLWTTVPNRALLVGPSSFSSGRRFPLASFQLRVSVADDLTHRVERPRRRRDRLVDVAAHGELQGGPPLPNRSHATPRRGLMSRQFGMFSSFGVKRARHPGARLGCTVRARSR